jgi:general transcriptional corepressor TUP1
LTLVINPRLRSANLTVDLVHCFDHNSVVCSVKFSPDGKYLATGCNHFSQIFEISSGRKILYFSFKHRALVDESITAKKDDLYIRSVCFSPDGVFLATGAEDRVIRVWDIAHGRVKLRLTGHEQDIYSLDWTKDGKYIVSGSGDRTVKVYCHFIKIWDAISGKLERTLENDLDPSVDKSQMKDSGVTSVALCPSEGKCIITVIIN